MNASINVEAVYCILRGISQVLKDKLQAEAVWKADKQRSPYVLIRDFKDPDKVSKNIRKMTLLKPEQWELSNAPQETDDSLTLIEKSSVRLGTESTNRNGSLEQ